MFCFDCHHRLVASSDKALSGEVQQVYRSTLTEEWVCEETGNEHRVGSATDYAERVKDTVLDVLHFVDAGDITAAQGLEVIAVDLGFKKRSEGSKRISAFLDAVENGIVPAEAIEFVLSKPEARA